MPTWFERYSAALETLAKPTVYKEAEQKLLGLLHRIDLTLIDLSHQDAKARLTEADTALKTFQQQSAVATPQSHHLLGLFRRPPPNWYAQHQQQLHTTSVLLTEALALTEDHGIAALFGPQFEVAESNDAIMASTTILLHAAIKHSGQPNPTVTSRDPYPDGRPEKAAEFLAEQAFNKYRINGEAIEHTLNADSLSALTDQDKVSQARTIVAAQLQSQGLLPAAALSIAKLVTCWGQDLFNPVMLLARPQHFSFTPPGGNSIKIRALAETQPVCDLKVEDNDSISINIAIAIRSLALADENFLTINSAGQVLIGNEPPDDSILPIAHLTQQMILRANQSSAGMAPTLEAGAIKMQFMPLDFECDNENWAQLPPPSRNISPSADTLSGP